MAPALRLSKNREMVPATAGINSRQTVPTPDLGCTLPFLKL